MTASSNENDIRLTETVIQESQANTSALKSATLRNYLFGASALVLCAGIAFALAIKAENEKADPELLKAAMAEAFRNMPPIEVKGSVTLADGAKVVVADGGKVGMAEDATVKLAEGGTVELDGIPAQVPQVLPQKTADGDSIERSLTVFSEVEAVGGNVITGWVFNDGKAGQKPTEQFCYQSTGTSQLVTNNMVHLAREGVAIPAQRSRIKNFDALFAKCVWWKPGAV